MAEDVQQASLPVDVCIAVLRGVQAVLPFTSPQRRAALLSAVTSLASRSKARSPVKAACLGFQQGLLSQKGAGLFPEPLTGLPVLPEGVIVDWVQVGSCLSELMHHTWQCKAWLDTSTQHGSLSGYSPAALQDRSMSGV